jgi:hypothetical protein
MELLLGNNNITFPDKYYREFLAKSAKHMVDPKESTIKNPKVKLLSLKEVYVITISFPDGTEGKFSVPRGELIVGGLPTVGR